MYKGRQVEANVYCTLTRWSRATVYDFQVIRTRRDVTLFDVQFLRTDERKLALVANRSYVRSGMTSPTKSPLHALILGGGVAGTTCAATLAACHPGISITLVDPAPAIKIASTVSRITSTASDINITSQAPESWCEKHGICFIQGVASHLTSNAVHLADGETYAFNVCCVATGASPILPQGLKDSSFADFVYMLRDNDSVDRVKRRLAGARRVVVVGAGGIAMEVVHEVEDCDVFWVVKGHIGGSFFEAGLGALIAGVNHKGVSSTDREAREKRDGGHGETEKLTGSGSGVGPDWLGARDGPVLLNRDGETIAETSGGRLHAAGGSKNLKVINAEVRKLMHAGRKEGGIEVHLSDGMSVQCDMIIVGAGVHPNTEWLRGSELRLDAEDMGIVTKCGSMQTTLRNVYAAGDCTHMIDGGESWTQMRVWSQAFVAGRAAGMEMGRIAGGEGYAGLEFEVFAHATRFFGKRVVLLGRFEGVENHGKTYERVGDGEIIRVHVVHGRVRGAVLVGDTDCAEVFENLIISGLDVAFLGDRIVDKDVELDEFFD